MDGFAFTRPQRTEFAMDAPAFWWECDGNDRLLCYRQHWKWYCSERGNTAEMLNATLAGAQAHPLVNVGVLMGLGNHGGGPTRRHLAETLAWAAQHPDVDLTKEKFIFNHANAAGVLAIFLHLDQNINEFFHDRIEVAKSMGQLRHLPKGK